MKYVCTPETYAYNKQLREKRELAAKLQQEEEDRKRKELAQARENKKKLIAAAAALRAPKKEVPVPTKETEEEEDIVIPYVKLPPEPFGIFDLYDDSIEDEPEPFDMYSKVKPPVPRRRHSITDPCNLTERFRRLRESTLFINFMRRRNSDPVEYKPMHPTERRKLPYVRYIIH